MHHVTTRVAAAAYAGCAPFEDHVTLTRHRIGANRLVASSAVHCKMKKRSASQLAGDVSERAKKAARSSASSPPTSCRVSFFSPGGVDQDGVVPLCVPAFSRLHRDSLALTLDYLFCFVFFPIRCLWVQHFVLLLSHPLRVRACVCVTRCREDSFFFFVVVFCASMIIILVPSALVRMFPFFCVTTCGEEPVDVCCFLYWLKICYHFFFNSGEEGVVKR